MLNLAQTTVCLPLTSRKIRETTVCGVFLIPRHPFIMTKLPFMTTYTPETILLIHHRVHTRVIQKVSGLTQKEQQQAYHNL